jgi:hypothetical protein
VLEICVRREAARHGKRRQVVRPRRQHDVAALGDAHRVAERIRMILEDAGHFGRRLQEKLARVVAQPLRIAERLAGTDAEQDVVRMMIGFAQVVHVVGAHHRQPEILRERRDSGVDDPLLLDAVPLHLKEEVVRPEDVAVRCRCLERLALLLV